MKCGLGLSLFKSKALGMTLRNLTFEVRRYFQLTKSQPGVIISKVKPAELASIAGIRIYEIITHINEAPIKNVDIFKQRIAGQKELRMVVKRFIKTRTVKIHMEP